MRTKNYIKTDERLFFFTLGAFSYLFAIRIYQRFDMETLIIVIGVTLLVLWIMEVVQRRRAKKTILSDK